MRQTGHRPKPITAEPIQFHGFKPRHIKRQIERLLAEMVGARAELTKAFMIDKDSYGNLLMNMTSCAAELPTFNTMPLPDYVNAFHASGMSEVLTTIEPIIVFMANAKPEMDILAKQMRRWGAFDYYYSLDPQSEQTNEQLWERTRTLLAKPISAADMTRRFNTYYLNDPERIEDEAKLDGQDLLEIEIQEKRRLKFTRELQAATAENEAVPLGLHIPEPESLDTIRLRPVAPHLTEEFEFVENYSIATQLLRRCIKDLNLNETDQVRSVGCIRTPNGSHTPVVLATQQGVSAIRQKLQPYRVKFECRPNKYGKPCMLH